MDFGGVVWRWGESEVIWIYRLVNSTAVEGVQNCFLDCF